MPNLTRFSSWLPVDHFSIPRISLSRWRIPSLRSSTTKDPTLLEHSEAHTTTTMAAGPNPNATPTPRTTICVYCGSSPGTSPAYLKAAQELGRLMAENNIALVYGGGTVGLMGEVAKTIVSIAGPDAVHGIIPEALVKWERDSTYSTTTDANGYHVPEEQIYGRTTVVKDMHTRKQMMAREVIEGGPGSGFIALPGGYGTMEELLETATWNQLGIHNKGVCLLNINGFYNGLTDWIRTAVNEGFVKAGNADILVTAKDAAGALAALREYKVSDARYGLNWGNE